MGRETEREKGGERDREERGEGVVNVKMEGGTDAVTMERLERKTV